MHATRLWTVTLEISVMMAQFPSERIAELSYRFRTLGLGYANVGGLLMTMGIAYDSPEGRALCGALTAIMTGAAYGASAEMAGELGAFPGYAANAGAMLRVIRNHRHAAQGHLTGYEGLAVPPVALDHASCPDSALVNLAHAVWDEALELGQRHGFRNAQVSVIAPTGTIGLVMDCDTTGIEPDFALVKFKKLAGGGYFKIINRSVPQALVGLGYRPAEVEEIVAYAVGHGTLEGAPEINPTALVGHGFGKAEIEKLEAALPTAFDIRFVFNQWTLGEAFCTRVLGIPAEKLRDPAFDLLAPPRVHPRPDRGGERPRLRHDDPRRRAAPEGRALPGLRLRQSLRQDGRAVSLGREPHPDDGGGAELHLGRDLEDDQHAERRDDRRLQGGLRALAGRSGSRRTRSTATARSCRSRCRRR